MIKPSLIIIPARNEEETVVRVVADVIRTGSYHVLVVDDASTDRTAGRAKEAGAVVLSLPLQLGAWGATQTGIRYALKNGYSTAVTMDADGQHNPRAVSALLQPLRENEADVVIGSFTERGSWQRRLAWRFFKLISGLKLEDLSSGFRAYNSAALALLASRDATLLDYQDVGVLILLQQQGLNIAEVETVMNPRKSGRSRIFSSWFKVFLYMLHSAILCFSRRKKPAILTLITSLIFLFNRRQQD